MNTERKWVRVPSTLFTADGREDGVVTVEDTFCFKVKMKVTIQSDNFQPTIFQVKRVISDTQMRLGPVSAPLSSRSDLTQFPLADNPIVKASEQDRPDIPPADYERAVYEEEPTMAKRVFSVDKYGRPWTDSNPFPVKIPPGIINADLVLPNKEGLKILDLTLKQNEESFTFPDGTKFYQIKVRDCKDVVKIGLLSGDISSGKYYTIEFGNEYSPEVFNDFPDNYTLFFESKHKNDVKLEIRYWYLV